MLFNIAICDDEPLEIEKINKHLTTLSLQTNIEFNVKTFTSGIDLVNFYRNNLPTFHMIFLDVEMPEMSGIETAEKIRMFPDRNVMLVFITSYPEYMQDSFDVQASQYLTKPLTYKIFETKILKLIHFLQESETNISVISSKEGEIVLHLDEIISFESLKHPTTKEDILVTTNKDSFKIKGKITDLEEKLKNRYFISVHRTTLVNMLYIKKFSSKTIFLTTGQELEASRRKLAEVKEAFSKYVVMRFKK